MKNDVFFRQLTDSLFVFNGVENVSTVKFAKVANATLWQFSKIRAPQ